MELSVLGGKLVTWRRTRGSRWWCWVFCWPRRRAHRWCAGFSGWWTGRPGVRPKEGEGGPELIDLRLVRAGKELPGGRWIGLLERAATYACIVAGFPAGIGVVMVVKGFGRYPELRTPDTAKSERFIIGTLASLLWASLWAGAVVVGFSFAAG